MAMNNNELLAIVSFIERERGVDREIVLVAIEQALQQAARRNPGVTNDLRVAIDRKTLSLHVYDTMVVSNEETGTGFISLARAQRLQPGIAEGETIEIEMPASKLGRIAAQTAKQVIVQRIREAEGEAEALLTVQKAQADAIRMINEANPNHNYLALRSMEAMEKVADGKATKLIVPSDMQNLAATVSAIKEISGEVTE